MAQNYQSTKGAIAAGQTELPLADMPAIVVREPESPIRVFFVEGFGRKSGVTLDGATWSEQFLSEIDDSISYSLGDIEECMHCGHDIRDLDVFDTCPKCGGDISVVAYRPECCVCHQKIDSDAWTCLDGGDVACDGCVEKCSDSDNTGDGDWHQISGDVDASGVGAMFAQLDSNGTVHIVEIVNPQDQGYADAVGYYVTTGDYSACDVDSMPIHKALESAGWTRRHPVSSTVELARVIFEYGYGLDNDDTFSGPADNLALCFIMDRYDIPQSALWRPSEYDVCYQWIDVDLTTFAELMALIAQDAVLARKGYVRDEHGMYPQIVDGGYPVYYVSVDGRAYCPPCASRVGTSLDGEIVDGDVNWEDSGVYCDGCGTRIESAYGEEE